jgi:hypothetical protein
MIDPLWFAARANVAGIGTADLINWAHPAKPQSWVVEVLVFDSVGGGAGSISMSSTTRHAEGGLTLPFTVGATGYARLIFGAQGDSGSIKVEGLTGGSALQFNATVMQVTSTPVGSNVSAW